MVAYYLITDFSKFSSKAVLAAKDNLPHDEHNEHSKEPPLEPPLKPLSDI